MYMQSGKVFYSITLGFSELGRFLSIDNEFDVLKRSQRLINEKRVKKLVKYIENDDFILPALTGYIEGDFIFEPIGKENLGYLKLPLDCVIKLFDGQHRASAIISACSKSFELKEKLSRSSITLNLAEYLDLDMRQQYFSDINSNASKPSISLSSTYNKNDARTELAHKVIGELALSGRIEYEKNVIRNYNTRNLYALYTFKSFSDSLAKAFGVKKRTLITDELVSKATLIYSAWMKLLNWELILDTDYYRKHNILLHNLMIITIGSVTKTLLDDNDYNIVIDKIKNSRIDYLESFTYKKMYDVCVDEQTNKIKLDALSKINLHDYIIKLIVETKFRDADKTGTEFRDQCNL